MPVVGILNLYWEVIGLKFVWNNKTCNKVLKNLFTKHAKPLKRIETFDVSTLPKYLVAKLPNVKLLLLHCQLANMISILQAT